MSLFSRVRDYFSLPPAPAAEPEPAAVEKAGPPTKPVGTSGQSYYAGHLATTESNAQMIGSAKWRFFDDAKRNVAAVAIGQRMYLTIGSTPDWTIEPYKARGADEPTAEDKERAEWLEDALGKMATPWKTAVQVGLLATWDGFSMQAWWLKRDAQGRLAPADLAWRPPHTIEKWLTDETNSITGVVQRSPQTQEEIEIPLSQMVWSRDLPITDSPEGIGVLRQLAESVRRLTELEQLLAKGFEKDVSQTPVMYGPVAERKAMIGQVEGGKTYTQADFDLEFQGVVTFADAKKRRGAAMVLDSATYRNEDGNYSNVARWKADVLRADVGTTEAIAAEIERVTFNVLAAVGLQFLLLGANGAGSHAQAATAVVHFVRFITTALNTYAMTVRRGFFQPIWMWNGWDPDTAPTATFGALELRDVAAIAQTFATLLTAAGIEPGRADHIVDQFLEILGLSRLKDRDDADMIIRREEAAEAAGLKRRTGEDEEDDDLDDEDEE